MSDEVWWARLSTSLNSRVSVYESRAAAKGELWPIRQLPLDIWVQFGGSKIKRNEIIPFRPLRIERVEVTE